MVVGHHKRLPRLAAYFFDALRPRLQFFFRIKIVVALMPRGGGIVSEPGVVAPTVQPHIADRRSRFRRRYNRLADDWLIDVAEAGVVLAQQFKGVGRLPR